MSEDGARTHFQLPDGTTIGPVRLPDRKRLALVHSMPGTCSILGYFTEEGEVEWERLLAPPDA